MAQWTAHTRGTKICFKIRCSSRGDFPRYNLFLAIAIEISGIVIRGNTGNKGEALNFYARSNKLPLLPECMLGKIPAIHAWYSATVWRLRFGVPGGIGATFHSRHALDILAWGGNATRTGSCLTFVERSATSTRVLHKLARASEF